MSDRLPASKHEKPNGVLDVFPGSFWSMPSPLPAPLTPLIGREAEAAMVADLLTSADVRLVTLTGPGGIGKTRLAFQLGADLAEAFTDGVTFVEFSTVRSPDLVVPTIGSALGLRPDNAHSPIDALLSVLRHRQMLLVLDNFEQVVDSGPDLTAVLRYCPEITMLVTSRTRLRIAAEHVVPVAPLAVPLNPNAVEPAHSPDQLSEIAAVRLFVQRARAVEPAFLLTERNASAVAAIVQRLDGLPLAIELAAARIPIFPPSELLERLEPRLPQLTGGPRDDPPRHQTMRDSIAWSYDLLTPVEQAVFRCLSVLTGGGSLAAAEAICEGQQSDPAPIVASGIRELLRPKASADTEARSPTAALLDIIESLMSQSLLQVIKPATDTPSEGLTRLMMLETVREFAAEQLAISGDQTPARRHAAYYLAVATRATRIFYGDEPGDWRALIEPEQGNLRTALAQVVESGDADSALSLASAMEWTAFVARGVWDQAGMEAALAREQEQWVFRALAMPGGSPIARARALTSAAWATLVQDRPRSSSLSEEALALARLHEDTFAMANASAVRGLAALHDGDTTLARPYLLDAMSGFRTLNQPGRAAWVLTELAVTETRKAVDEGGDPDALDRAIAYYEEALAFFETIGQNRGISRALHGIAYVAYMQRNLPEALERTREILARDWEQGAPVTHYIEDIADIAGRIGRPDVAVRLYGAAEAHRERIGRPIHSLYKEEYEREVAISRQAMSEKAFAAGWAAGRSLSQEAAVEEALFAFERETGPATQSIFLSPRESEVLQLLVAGHTDREIAELLFISPRTSEGHVRGLCRKLGARNRATAIAMALAGGLVEPLTPPGDDPAPPG